MRPPHLPNHLALIPLAFALAVGTLPAQETASVEPFRVAVPDTVLTDLRERLARTRWPASEIDGAGWDYGVPMAYLKSLTAYWADGYDWRRQEAALNAIPQFRTRIDGVDLHYFHVRSPHPDALPLVLVHGWPGSVWEFHRLIGPLTDPVAHGGRAEDAFHVVCPSLPGFGFSSQPTERGWSSQRMAETIAKLMARLGYDRYGAQGGDWGGNIVSWLASGDAAHCIGAHSNFPGASAPTDDPRRDVTPAEIARMESRQKELADHRAYGAIQGTRPQTLAYGLNDSPAGLCAWIVDKFWAWSDHDGDLDNSYSRDDLLTNVMIYWITDSMPSSVRIYYESQHNQERPASMTPFTTNSREGKPAPMGFALFPKEINVPPRAWVARARGEQMIHWTDMPRGGHFAALEQPELLLEDVRTFFRLVR
ncbi:MAG: alpha/beta fold hydrolase [Verrucomicrobiales bacterium]|nr:alpha/beta fold hydrolase [Verrucomicrobiales bacterium]